MVVRVRDKKRERHSPPKFWEVGAGLRAVLHEESGNVYVGAVAILLTVFAAQHRHRGGKRYAARAVAVEAAAQERRASLGELLRLRLRDADAGLLGEHVDEVFPCARVEVVLLRRKLGNPEASVGSCHARLRTRPAEGCAGAKENGERGFVGVVLLETTRGILKGAKRRPGWCGVITIGVHENTRSFYLKSQRPDAGQVEHTK